MRFLKKMVLLLSLLSFMIILTSCPGLINSPPEKPELIYPENNAKGVELKPTLKWYGTDKDNDPLKYDLYIYKGEELIFSQTDIEDTEYTLSVLEPNTTYKWYVVAKDPYSKTQSDE